MQHSHAGADLHRQPRREDEGGEQREHHGDAAEHRDRRHVRSHHAAHGRHRQQRRDHGEGRQNGGVAHLGHGVDRRLGVDPPLLQPSPVDVFEHHHRVVDEDADGKDQREQTDAVDGKAHDQRHEHGEQDDDRHDDDDDHAGAPAEEKPDQHHHGAGSDEELEDQLVDLLLRGLAVVPRHRDVDVVGNERTFQLLDQFEDVIGDGDAIGALLLGDGERDGRRAIGLDTGLVGRAGVVGDDRLGVTGTALDLGHVTQVNGTTVVLAHHQPVQVVLVLEERTAVYRRQRAVGLGIADAGLGIGGLDRAGDMLRRNAETGQLLGKDVDRHLLATTADDEALRGIGNLLDVLEQIERNESQRRIRHVLRPQREGHQRHIVDALRLDQRLADAGRDLVHVGRQLVVELDQRRPHLLADDELDGDDRLVAHGGGVDVIHPLDLHHDLLQRHGHLVDHLLGAGAGILDEDIDHRYRDLRVFLPRRGDQPHDTQQEKADQQQRRQRRVDELLRQPPGNADVRFFLVF